MTPQAQLEQARRVLTSIKRPGVGTEAEKEKAAEDYLRAVLARLAEEQEKRS